MITLSEFKNYLGIVDTDKDGILQGFISSAISFLDSSCNRTFLKNNYTEYIKDCNVTGDKLYLRNAPINTVTSIYYYDGEDYINLFSSPDTIADSITNQSDYILLRKGYSVYRKELKVVYNAGYKFTSGTGTIRVLVGSVNVEGLNSSLFETEITVGDYLCFEGERIKVASITDNELLVLESPVSRDFISVGYNISNVPEDLRQGCKELAMKLYYDSPIGQNLLFRSAYSTSGQTSTSVQYKELDQSKLINTYKFVNI